MSDVSPNPKVKFETKFGDIIIEIYLDKAPVTGGNFLKYMDKEHWKNAKFYRVLTENNQINPVKVALIQGGFGEQGLGFMPASKPQK